MATRPRFAGFALLHLLLLLTAAELAFNRLATRELRPLGEESPPWWHQALDHIGLFCQYFASTLAICIIARELWRLGKQRHLYWSVPRWGLIAAGAVFLAAAAFSLGSSPGEHGSLVIEGAFAAMVFLLVLGQATRGGDLPAKLGIAALSLPLLIPFCGHLWLWLGLWLGNAGEAIWGELPEQIRQLGQWSMIVTALVLPFCFAPRPLLAAFTRIGPLVVAMFVGAVGMVILRQHYEVGMRLAQNGLGIDLGPDAPARFLSLSLVALSTITWTLTSCLSADAVARRDIGVGLGLIVAGGYGFAWPLQYLVSMAGLMAIGEACARVADEERTSTAAEPAGYRAPPIAEAVWQAYVAALATALADEDGFPPTIATTSDEKRGNLMITSANFERRGVDVVLRIERLQGSVSKVDIICGGTGHEWGAWGDPQWTMYALPERLLGIGAHPEPPTTSAPVRKLSDASFAQRFRIRDAGGYTERLLDDGMRARATALIDGWLAFWDKKALGYRVLPGQGAPLDHPIPITELAFRGQSASPSAERLVTLLDLLIDIAIRGALLRSRPLPDEILAKLDARVVELMKSEPESSSDT